MLMLYFVLQVNIPSYHFPNTRLKTKSSLIPKFLIIFNVKAHLAETTIFLELGLSLFGLSNLNYFHWIFIIWALLACLIGRAMNIYPLTCLVNHSLRNRLENKRMKPSTEMKVASLNSGISCEGILENEIAKDETFELEGHNVLSCSSIDQKIRSSTSHMLCFSGLRGAVAYSCAKNFPDGNRIDFVCTTMVIILVTVFFLGCSTESALIRLGIDMNVNEDQYMNDNHTEEKMIFMTNFGKNIIVQMHTNVQTSLNTYNFKSICSFKRKPIH